MKAATIPPAVSHILPPATELRFPRQEVISQKRDLRLLFTPALTYADKARLENNFQSVTRGPTSALTLSSALSVSNSMPIAS